jgi:antitoxin PrlF
MPAAAVTSKGQITIPVEVRKKHGIKTGDRLDFTENERGELVLRRKTRSIMDLAGIGKWEGPPVTIEEMNETIRQGWSGLLREYEGEDIYPK